MEIVVLKEDLEKALSTVSRFVSTRTQLPILANVFLSASGGQLDIKGTNLEVGISIKIGADIKREGKTTVLAKTFFEVINSLEQGRIEIKEDKEELVIGSSLSGVRIPTTPAQEYPAVSDKLPKEKFALNQGVFESITQQVVFASGADSQAKPEFSGVLFAPRDSQIQVVATDGVRLSRKLVEVKIKLPQKTIIPSSTISEVSKIFGLGEDIGVALDSKENQVVFGSEKIVITSRVINAEFPDFERIIPQGFSTKISVGREELQSALRLASIFAEDHKVNFKTTGDGVITILSQHPQLGQQTSRVSAKIEGEEIEVAFNWRFVKEFLGAVANGEVVIELNGPSAPGVFRDPKDESFIHLIMPIKITQEAT